MLRRTKQVVKRALARRLADRNLRALEGTREYRNGRLAPELWDCTVNEAGELMMGGVSLRAVAEEFGTPIHVVDADRLRRNARGFVEAFTETRARVRLGTSYKTNPVPWVLRTLHEEGTLAEVISHFELWMALRLGMPPERIIFNGPGKPLEALELAAERGIWLVNADSMEELHALAGLCRTRGLRQRVGIRVTTSVGWQSQFGLPISDGSALEGIRFAAESPWLDPVGVHLHLGTGIGDVETYVRGITEVLELGLAAKRDLGVEISVLDLGGGFGVPTTRGRDEWDGRMQHLGMPIRTALPRETPVPGDYARRLVPLLNGYFQQLGSPEAEVIFEPGRAITASAQTLLLKVLRVKERGGEPDVILDGGKNVSTPLGWEFHEIHPANRMLDDDLVPQNLYGPLCHPHDVVALHKPLPALRDGDVVAVMDAGAYFIPSQTNFSNPRPGVVAIDQGTPRLVRQPEKFDDIIRLDDVVPEPTRVHAGT